MRFQRRQAEVVLDDLVVIVSLGNEQVRAARRRDQRLRPFGIGAVADDAALRLDAVGEKWPAGFAVHDRVGRDLERAKTAALLRIEGDDGEFKALFGLRGMLE